jgi:hypothetical protein
MENCVKYTQNEGGMGLFLVPKGTSDQQPRHTSKFDLRFSILAS